VDDPILQPVQDIKTDATCDFPLFQNSNLTAIATFGGVNLVGVPDMDVTCAVTFELQTNIGDSVTNPFSLVGSFIYTKDTGNANVGLAK
jgi:hypothetical protein